MTLSNFVVGIPVSDLLGFSLTTKPPKKHLFSVSLSVVRCPCKPFFLFNFFSFGFHHYLHWGPKEWVTNFLGGWLGGGFT